MDRKNKEQNGNSKQKSFLELILSHPYILIISLIVVSYIAGLFFDYVYYDDHYLLFDTPDKVEKLTKIDKALTKSYMRSSYYRPVVNLSFFIDALIAAEKPWINHLTNIIIHSLNCCLFFFLMKKMKYSRSISLLTTVIYSVHPIFTNAVTWIVGRNDLLVATFTLLSLIFFIKYMESEKPINLALHGLALIFAVFSKELAMIIPLLFVVYWFIFLRRKFETKHIMLIFVWILPVILLLYLKFTLKFPMSDPNFSIFNFFYNYRSIPETIFKVIFPFYLPILPSYTITLTLLGLAIIIAAIVFYARKSENLNKRNILFGLLWFLIFLLPSLFVRITRADQRVSDYLDCRAYLPIMGLMFILIELLPKKIFDLKNKLNLLFSGILIVLLVFLTIDKSFSYKNVEVFRKDAAKHNPNILPNFVDNDPKEVQFIVDQASKKRDRGDLQGAIDDFSKLIKMVPGNDLFYANRGYLKMKMKDFKAALDDYNKAIEYNPEASYSYMQRAYIRISQKDFKSAVADLNKYVQLEPNNFLGYYQRALSKGNLGEFTSALDDCTKCIEIKPDFSEAYVQRAIIRAQFKNKKEACEDLEKARSLGNRLAGKFINEICNEQAK